MPVNRLASLLIVSLLLFVGCKSKDAMLTPASTTIKDALLWKISKKDVPHDSYLYGTIHIIESDDYFLPKGTLTAMDASSKMIFEIDMTEMDDPAKQMGMLSKAFMNDGLTLDDLLSAEDYAIVEKHFKDLGLPLFMLERIKPMFLSVFAMGGEGLNMGGLQDGSIKSYEMEFMDIARQQNKPIGGLETIDYQISVFDSIPYTEQANMLVEMIQESDSDSEQFDDMVKMYRSQDISKMAGSLQDESSGMGDYEDILLRKRNENWIPIMGQEMATQPTFFAVGAAHLAGPHGVIPLLRKAGYTLTPISHIE